MTVTNFKSFIKEAADAEADHNGFASWHEKEANKYAAIAASHSEASKAHGEKQKAAQTLGNKQRHQFFTDQIHSANSQAETAKKISSLHKTIADSHRSLVGLGLGKKAEGGDAEKETVKENWNDLLESYKLAEKHATDKALAEAYANLTKAYADLLETQ